MARSSEEAYRSPHISDLQWIYLLVQNVSKTKWSLNPAYRGHHLNFSWATTEYHTPTNTYWLPYSTSEQRDKRWNGFPFALQHTIEWWSAPNRSSFVIKSEIHLSHNHKTHQSNTIEWNDTIDLIHQYRGSQTTEFILTVQKKFIISLSNWNAQQIVLEPNWVLWLWKLPQLCMQSGFNFCLRCSSITSLVAQLQRTTLCFSSPSNFEMLIDSKQLIA